MKPFFTNDAIVLGLLITVLAFVFVTSSSKARGWQTFYKYVPALFLCYAIPALLHWPLGLISGESSKLYTVASQYFLPASLILLCVSTDLKMIVRLGPKALIMFLAGTLGVVLGGPVALLFVANVIPGALSSVSPDEMWRGFSTIAGSWIGGGANQAAMKIIYEVDNNLFASMVVVDIIVANIWMAFLLYGASISDRMDRFFRADSSAIEAVKEKVANYQASVSRIPDTKSLFVMLAVAFGGVGLSHWGAESLIKPLKAYNESTKGVFEYREFVVAGQDTTSQIITEGRYDTLAPIQRQSGGMIAVAGGGASYVSKTVLKEGYIKGALVDNGLSTILSNFFWVVVLATTFGLLLSFVPQFRELEGVGASRWGSIFIYLLVATIGMQMNLGDVFNKPGLFAVGGIWMLIHATVLIVVARLIRAPFFFFAVGSQANIGGAASAPVVASAFSPSLASVGVLLAVLGYALGTYGAIICAGLMRWAIGAG